MLFYQIEVELQGEPKEPERSERMERATALQPRIEQFFEKQERACHITVVNILDCKQKALLCAAVQKSALAPRLVEEFLAVVDLEYKRYDAQEITLETYCLQLRVASHHDFISDEDDVTEKLNINGLDRRGHGRDIRFSETIVSGTAQRQELSAKARALLCRTDMSPELERIFQGSRVKKASGHPVHYLLQTNHSDSRNQMLSILMLALYENGRVQSRRYCEVTLDGYDDLPEKGLGLLYESCAGGTVVISFGEADPSDGEHAHAGADIIAGLCSTMRKYRNRVLTVFCLPKVNPKIKEVFLEHLGTVTIVPICEETAFGDNAKGYLRTLAKTHGAAPDKALYKPVAEGKGYSAADLDLIFDQWYDRRLKTRVYTQYADLESVSKHMALKKPKGSAVDELARMIGLSEAKRIIQQALDFYKAQKLFREKGFPTERPAMHMIFTGNPGTAKTTVARLFARIMKDNNLLSAGDLLEVGRADLVGKYVGWTAQIVKQKFKAAKGSVLFIDEAYSLVEEKDGLYGDEAINTIVQEMENSREDMVVIFAGYPDKMESFLQKNPGLRSRIAFHVPFEDYSARELWQIAELLAEQNHRELDTGVQDKLLAIFEAAMGRADFGNGRFVRNVFEKAVMKQATRLVSMDVDSVSPADVRLLLAQDFEALVIHPPQKLGIGF